MASEKNNVLVELYDYPLSGRPDDRFGKVVTTKSLSENDLVNIAVQRRTDINPITLRASLSIMKEIAIEQVANGASVQFGLGFYSLEVKGVFIGNKANWDPDVHRLSVRTTASAELREVVKNINVTVKGMANVGTVINTLTDITTGEENTRITPGGGINLTGNKLKILGDNVLNGIYLINQTDAEETPIPANTILVNDPKRISFVAPISLPAGDYKLRITTQYSGSTKLLKEARTYLFDYVLAVQ